MRGAKVQACPCGSQHPYRSCCQVYHRGCEPPDPPTLVRSRFAAFALGEGDYLWRTLHPEHPLRAESEPAVVRALSAARRTLRYRSVIIHDNLVSGARGRVLFSVRLFEGGWDRSFLEASDFERTPEGWRYREGVLWPLAEQPARTLAELGSLAGFLPGAPRGP